MLALAHGARRAGAMVQALRTRLSAKLHQHKLKPGGPTLRLSGELNFQSSLSFSGARQRDAPCYSLSPSHSACSVELFQARMSQASDCILLSINLHHCVPLCRHAAATALRYQAAEIKGKEE